MLPERCLGHVISHANGCVASSTLTKTERNLVRALKAEGVVSLAGFWECVDGSGER